MSITGGPGRGPVTDVASPYVEGLTEGGGTPVPRARRGRPGDGLAPPRPPGPHQSLVFYTSQCSAVALGECMCVVYWTLLVTLSSRPRSAEHARQLALAAKTAALFPLISPTRSTAALLGGSMPADLREHSQFSQETDLSSQLPAHLGNNIRTNTCTCMHAQNARMQIDACSICIHAHRQTP